MYLLQYQKLYNQLESVVLAHKLISVLQLREIYVVRHPYACDGKPGYNMFVDDFKWELSDTPGEWARVVLSIASIGNYRKNKIEECLNKNSISYRYNNEAVVIIELTDLNDQEIQSMVEITDLYLSLKSSLQF